MLNLHNLTEEVNSSHTERAVRLGDVSHPYKIVWEHAGSENSSSDVALSLVLRDVGKLEQCPGPRHGLGTGRTTCGTTHAAEVSTLLEQPQELQDAAAGQNLQQQQQGSSSSILQGRISGSTAQQPSYYQSHMGSLSNHPLRVHSRLRTPSAPPTARSSS